MHSIQNRATTLVVDLDDTAREVAAAMRSELAEPVRGAHIPDVWADDLVPVPVQAELFATESLRRRANLR